MTDKSSTTGRCLCGNVTYSVAEKVDEFSVCHCNMCRRSASGPFFAVHCGTEVQFDGEDHIGRYKSSEWAERGFCKTCGSNLFYFLIQTGEYMLAAGTFDDQNDQTMSLQVFIDEKPDSYDFTNDTQKMTGEELIALYGPQD